MHIVRRHVEDVILRHCPGGAGAILIALALKFGADFPDDFCFFFAGLGIGLVLDRNELDARALFDEFERSLRQEYSHIRRDGRLILKVIVECGLATPFGMRALEWLTELHLVADEHDVFCGARHVDDVGERHLSR